MPLRARATSSAPFVHAVGDYNPVHSDRQYAASTVFKAPIAPGIWTAGLVSAVIGTLVLCGFPQPYHPVFNVKRFRERGSTDGLFLCVEAADSKFDAATTRGLLQSLGARGVYDIEP